MKNARDKTSVSPKDISTWRTSRLRALATQLPLTRLLAISALLIALDERSAQAAPTEIRWEDFSATHQECHTECTQYDWVEEVDWWFDGETWNQETSYDLECVAERDVCNAVRTPLPDGDLIDVTIDHNATDSSAIEFRLALGSGITWFKQLDVNGWKVWNWDDGMYCNWPSPATRGCDTNADWTSLLLSGAIVFSKSKGPFGGNPEVYVLRNLSSRLHGGDRVTFTWIKD